MSQNVVSVIENIFTRLSGLVDEEDKSRIISTKRYIVIDEKYKNEAFKAAKHAEIKQIRTNDRVNIFTANYKEERYIVLLEKHFNMLDVVGLVKENDDGIQQGIGILAMSSDCISIKDGLSSLEVINQCLEISSENGADHVDFTYNQIADFFEEFIVAKILNTSIKVSYMEDLLRMHGIMLTISSNNSLSDKACENLRDLLFLESSRSISTSIINLIQSGMNEHKFLQLYQCIEYLFIIHNAIELSEKYPIDKKTAVGIIANEGFRRTEISNVVNIISTYTEGSLLNNFYDAFFQGEECSNKSEKVANYIYKVRCNVAHLRYNQEQFLETIQWRELIENVTNIVLSIYNTMDDKINKLCKDTDSWVSLGEK
ncbi:hypothetical protein C8U37_10872 [Trichococcus patagoniensis]|uniref:Uncharacterized protein n=1 Tax=Trichococcus patagoniensis TaxID=382641 RepID=A0A2T5IKZ5_9LACT|nr:hypothetical protein [Trichococcus patagoniensis]PTQ84505.1 hypothetical protein C8U37_10872 [Trichococcus patagoniensis]